MPNRRASPTPSEQEVDIVGSLYPGDGDEHGLATPPTAAAAGHDLDMDSILNVNNPAEADGEGDEAFIALHQSASYRKASNLKGRTVKKGGGFQAMGKI